MLKFSLPFQKMSQDKLEIHLIPNFNLNEMLGEAVTW